MKIDRDKKGIGSYISPGKSQIPEVKRVNPGSFEQELMHKRESELQLRMKEILKELDRIGGRLSRNLNINDLMLYKRMVKSFLQEATLRAYALNKERGRSRRGRTLLFTISVIDEEVNAMIDDFMNHKKEPVEILNAMDKIRGMLVDLIA
jgi:uncharacterized protein YaaR (DUF327 family)